MGAASPSFGRRSGSEASRSTGVRTKGSLLSQSPAKELLRIERSHLYAARGLILILIGMTIFKIDKPGLLLIAASLLMITGGITMISDYLLGKPRLVVDDEGLHNDCILLSRTMRWEDIHDLTVTNVYWRPMVNARSLKLEGSDSNVHVYIPNSAFKLTSLAFVRELLIRRPDLSESVLDVMKKVGATKQIQQLLLIDKSIGAYTRSSGGGFAAGAQ